MIDLAKLQTDSQLIYYIVLLVGSTFVAGYYLNTKIKNQIEEIVFELTRRVDRLELETLKAVDHQKDMTLMFNLIKDVKEDIRSGFAAVSSRIDTVLTHK